MDILIGGATELGIAESYVQELKAIRVQEVGAGMRVLAVHYLFLITTLFKLKAAWMVRSLSWMLWRAYVPSTCQHAGRRAVGSFFTALLLLPGAAVGALIRLSLLVTSSPPSPMLAALMAVPPASKHATPSSVPSANVHANVGVSGEQPSQSA